MASGRTLIDTMRKGTRHDKPVFVKSPTEFGGDRQMLIEWSQKAALADSAFLASVQLGDSMRNQQRWQEAEAGYANALHLFPYERTYWVQLGHMAKEQGKFVYAEIAYRTACSLGVTHGDVAPHLRHVLACQMLDEGRFPIRFYRAGPAASQPPAQPDVLLLARLMWGVRGLADTDLLGLIRRSETCDELAANMCRDPRFERFNRAWLEVVAEDEL